MITAVEALRSITARGLVRLARARIAHLPADEADALIGEIDSLRRLVVAKRDDAWQAQRTKDVSR